MTMLPPWAQQLMMISDGLASAGSERNGIARIPQETSVELIMPHWVL